MSQERVAQCAGAVLMVRPAAFGYNPETAQTNRFMRAGAEEAATDRERALAEFDGAVQSLRAEGMAVCVAQDPPVPAKPDAVFPNNWVSFHADGTVVLYPMQAASRRPERRTEIIEQVTAELGYAVRRTVDLTHHERDGRFLEGTGSLVLDHPARVAYACRSPRTHPWVIAEWADALGYEPVLFDAADRGGVALYHTNVVLGIGARAAIVASEAIAAADRDRVLRRLAGSGRDVIEIGHSAMEGFGANVLELATWDEALGDSTVLALSSTARRALEPQSFARLAACTDTVLTIPVPTIERLGGGSIRCMLAEVFV